MVNVKYQVNSNPSTYGPFFIKFINKNPHHYFIHHICPPLCLVSVSQFNHINSFRCLISALTKLELPSMHYLVKEKLGLAFVEKIMVL